MNDSIQDKEFTRITHTDQELPQVFQGLSEYSVNVSIEPNHETEIYEVQFNDNVREVTEIFKEPPSYSDKLAELISKIDFGDLIQDKTNEGSTLTTSSQTQNENADSMTARKLYQNIYERVKLSLDEICVLCDLLTLVKANKLMTVEHFSDEYKPNDMTDKIVSVLLKKKNIEKAKALLKKSLDKISNDQEYSNIKFHLELYRARQLWKIRKIGTKFNCDLSYRSVGCINAIKLNIELNKNDLPLNPQENNPAKALYLSAIIPEEFKDYAYIQVKIVKTTNKGKKDPLFDSKFSLFTYYNNSTNPQGCQELLEREQNSLYCREIYENILKEIFDPNNQSQLKPIIIGNSIQIMITMDYDLVINLVHTNEKNLNNVQQCPKNYNYDNALLEYYLHCLLKKSFDQNFYHYDQKPITSTFAFNSNVKIAGMAYANLNLDEEDSVISIPQNISHLLNKNRKINLLQSIKEKTEHLILRKRILKILNSISKKSGSTHLSIEQSAWNSATSSNITVTISSYYYNMLAKSYFYIIIKKSSVSILNRSDNISISFTGSLNDLKEYFIDQCCFHQINLILTLCQQYGWTVLGNSFTNEPNKRRMCGVGLVYHNKYAKKIAIKVEQVNKIQVYVNQYNNSNESLKIDAEVKSLFGDLSVDWIFVKDNFTQIDLEYYPDFTVIQKFELFLAHYSTPNFVEQI